MSSVCLTGNPEGEHDVLGKGGGYVVTWSDPLHDAGWTVGSFEFYVEVRSPEVVLSEGT